MERRKFMEKAGCGIAGFTAAPFLSSVNQEEE